MNGGRSSRRWAVGSRQFNVAQASCLSRTWQFVKNVTTLPRFSTNFQNLQVLFPLWRGIGGGFFLLFFSIITLSAQETKERNWNVQGYTKSLQSLFNLNLSGVGNQTISDNFIHNRLNFDWYPSDNWTFKAGLRTRFFFGERDFARITE